ncbi:MAG: porin [Ramlibacter sp.]|jgi:predicted porin|nr:porin [Ramlibacter sp.]
MKKSLIALAVMAAAGAASAQSSVTLFGIVDAGLQWSKGSSGDVRFAVINSGYNSSRLGFRGTEDLGGGMAASFWLEAGVNNDNGSGQNTVGNSGLNNALSGGGLTFNRRSTVSLSGGWGELRIGRDYTPSFWNLTVFDPFGTNGSGTTATLQGGATGVNTVRASNSIGYFMPANIGGVYGQVQYAENELPNNTGPLIDSGRYLGFRVGYASGPFNVAFAAGRTDVPDVVGADNILAMNLGGSWDFGFLKLMGQLVMDRNTAGVDTNDGKGFLIGGLVPVGAGEIRLAYSQYKFDTPLGDPKVKKMAVGYVHNLSKRTAVYATLAHLKNSGGAAQAVNGNAVGAANDSSSAVDLGIRHSF